MHLKSKPTALVPISRRDSLKVLTLGLTAHRPLFPSRLEAAQAGRSDFVDLVRSYTVKDALSLDVNFTAYRTIIPLKDGSLYSLITESTDSRRPWVSTTKRSISRDHGATWSKPEPMLDVQGREARFENNNESLLRLKSGALGLMFARNEDGEAGREAPPAREYGLNVWFCKSTDEGKTWSQPTRVGEPFNKVWKYWNSAIVTTKGRIVVPVFSLIGKTTPERGRALLGDHIVGVGAHGYEQFFTYSWVYYSDDEGETWKPNQGKSIWAAGGELFVTLDHSAGGHHGCEEPVMAEVSPDHLLMLFRTPLGRFYQSWSQDDGTSWSRPEPTVLASSYAPATLKRIPGSDHLLAIWNQASADEIQRGLQRHRLSSAISKDGGASWKHGKNIFSIFLDREERTYLEPPPIRVYRASEQSSRLPRGYMEGTYPALYFSKDRAIVVFGSGEPSIIDESTGQVSHEDDKRGRSAYVTLSLPVSWFYG